MVSDRQTALRILGLTEGATDDEIRDAYKRMSMRWHPDKNSGSAEATHMMQQINAAKGQLSRGAEEDEDSGEWTEDDDDYDEDEEEEGSDYYYDDPFGDYMDFAAFLRMYSRMTGDTGYEGYDGPSMPSGPGGRNGMCMCGDCVRARRQQKEDRRARNAELRAQRAAAEARRAAEEAEDLAVQEANPRASRAWAKGGDARDALVRRHFLRQAPRLVLAEAGEDYLLLRLDVPDTSLLLDGKMPPRGVQWEVSYSRAGQPRSTTLPADKDFDNVLISKLTPGTTYVVAVRTGAAGSLTWSGSPEWGPWAPPARFITAGKPPLVTASAAGAAAKTKAGKKKKNRDFGFEKLVAQVAAEEEQRQEGEEGEEGADSAEQQQQQQQQQEEQSPDQPGQQQAEQGDDQAPPLTVHKIEVEQDDSSDEEPDVPAAEAAAAGEDAATSSKPQAAAPAGEDKEAAATAATSSSKAADAGAPPTASAAAAAPAGPRRMQGPKHKLRALAKQQAELEAQQAAAAAAGDGAQLSRASSSSQAGAPPGDTFTSPTLLRAPSPGGEGVSAAVAYNMPSRENYSWFCPACHHLNWPQKTSCKACNGPRGPNPVLQRTKGTGYDQSLAEHEAAQKELAKKQPELAASIAAASSSSGVTSSSVPPVPGLAKALQEVAATKRWLATPPAAEYAPSPAPPPLWLVCYDPLDTSYQVQWAAARGLPRPPRAVLRQSLMYDALAEPSASGPGGHVTADEASADAAADAAAARHVPKFNTPCRFWPLGQCRFGHRCQYTHLGPGGCSDRPLGASPQQHYHQQNQQQQRPQMRSPSPSGGGAGGSGAGGGGGGDWWSAPPPSHPGAAAAAAAAGNGPGGGSTGAEGWAGSSSGADWGQQDSSSNRNSWAYAGNSSTAAPQQQQQQQQQQQHFQGHPGAPLPPRPPFPGAPGGGPGSFGAAYGAATPPAPPQHMPYAAPQQQQQPPRPPQANLPNLPFLPFMVQQQQPR